MFYHYPTTKNLVTVSTNIRETKESYLIEAELPGVKKEDIEITAKEGYLTISGQKNSLNEEVKGDYTTIERSRGSFSRTLLLPKGVDSDKIEAKLADGILSICIPKPLEKKEKQIDIN